MADDSMTRDEAARLLLPELDTLEDGVRRRFDENAGFQEMADALAERVNRSRGVLRSLVQDYRRGD
jgi:hypothetical protein